MIMGGLTTPFGRQVSAFDSGGGVQDRIDCTSTANPAPSDSDLSESWL
jgi:hypothetical protein